MKACDILAAPSGKLEPIAGKRLDEDSRNGPDLLARGAELGMLRLFSRLALAKLFLVILRFAANDKFRCGREER